jgi:hypothetical protein
MLPVPHRTFSPPLRAIARECQVRLLAIAGLVAFLALTRGARAQTSSDSAASLRFDQGALRGLAGVAISIKATEEALRAGLDTTRLRALVELELRRSRIRILTAATDSAKTIMLQGLLTVGVSYGSAAPEIDGRFVYTRITLAQLVQPVRDPAIRTFAYTWESGYQPQFLETRALQRGTEESLRTQLTGFMNDYLKANP